MQHGVIDGQNNIHLGSNVWINKFCYDNINREVKPGKFVCSMAYEVWGHSTLKDRVVRVQKNTSKTSTVLTPTKKMIVANEFEKWLQKRQFPAHLAQEQLKDINKYFNSAITGAKRSLKMTDDNPEKKKPDEEEQINN